MDEFFLSENKILCEFFQAAIFANFEQLITGGVVEAAFVLTRMSFQKQKVSQYPQNLLFFHLWAIASGLVFCIMCSLQMKFLSYLIWKTSEFYAFFSKVA